MSKCASEPLRPAIATALAVAALFVASSAGADVVVDGRLRGVADTTLPGLDVEVPAEVGVLEGSSLFHAFRTFGVETGGSATFLAPLGGDPVGRVIALVTGCATGCEAATRIDGPLALAPGIHSADLYLVDPNGVVFGEGARLDVGGSFTVGSAHAIELADGGLFLAMDPGPGASTLTAAPPEAFGFLAAPSPIAFEGAQLEAPNGLTVVGGDLTVDGTRTDSSFGFLATAAERVDLVSLASSGRVGLVPAADGGLDVAATDFGRLRLANGAVVSSSGLSPAVSLGSPVPPVPAPGAGDVYIRGGELVVEGGARVQSFTTTYSDGGDIDVELTGDLIVRDLDSGFFAGSGLVVDPDFTGSTRVLDVIPVGDGAFPFIEVERRFDGSPAEIASRCVPGACRVAYGGFNAFDGDPSTTRALGDTGDVRVAAENVRIVDGGEISSTSFFGGDAGAIVIESRGDVSLSGAPDLFAGSFDAIRGGLFANAQGGGNAGRIEIRAETLDVDDFGAVVTELRGGAGAGGDVDVRVDDLRIAGNGRIDTSTRGDGDAGAITILATGAIRVSGALDADEFSGITSLSQSEATGDAGSLLIEGATIDLSRGARISTAAFGGGDAGIVDVRFHESMVVDRGQISAEALGAFGGDIYLNGGPISVGAGGELSISTPPGVTTTGNALRLVDARISTSVASGVGSGGNVAIQSGQLALFRSAVTADADVSNGGNIRIVAGRFSRDESSLIRASSNLGEDGRIEIDTFEGILIPPLLDLPAGFLDAASLLREPCAVRVEEAASSLVVPGADGAAPGPDQYLPSVPLPDDAAAARPDANSTTKASPGLRFAVGDPAGAGERCPTRTGRQAARRIRDR